MTIQEKPKIIIKFDYFLYLCRMIRDDIRKRLHERGLSQQEISTIIGVASQNFSGFLRGKRDLSLKESLILDRILSFPEGYIQHRLLDERIASVRPEVKESDFERDRRLILERIKKNGGLWSYEGVPYELEDDDVIEEGLRHLDFEDMHLLFGNWSKSHIKRIWKERLLPEGSRLNILNFLLGILFFDQTTKS